VAVLVQTLRLLCTNRLLVQGCCTCTVLLPALRPLLHLLQEPLAGPCWAVLLLLSSTRAAKCRALPLVRWAGRRWQLLLLLLLLPCRSTPSDIGALRRQDLHHLGGRWAALLQHDLL
jgi:hypothetical protein